MRSSEWLVSSLHIVKREPGSFPLPGFLLEFRFPSALSGVASETWWSLLNPLADLLHRVLGSKVLKPPDGTCLGKCGHARRISSFVGPTGQSIGNRIERHGLHPLSMDKGQDLLEVLWCEGATAHLWVDPIELCRTAKGLLCGQVYPVVSDFHRFWGSLEFVVEVIPEKEAVPPRFLGDPGQLGNQVRITERTKGREMDGKLHRCCSFVVTSDV